MTRRVFYSFHYSPDVWRVSQIREIGAIEGNAVANDNDWETIKKGGDTAIQGWINKQLDGRSCTIVLIGEDTANRKWINYEIDKSWKDGKGVLGIYIHNLKDRTGKTSHKGSNPFDYIKSKTGTKLSSIVKAYDPPFILSTDVYNHISGKLSDWIEEAIKIRSNN